MCESMCESMSAQLEEDHVWVICTCRERDRSACARVLVDLQWPTANLSHHINSKRVQSTTSLGTWHLSELPNEVHRPSADMCTTCCLLIPNYQVCCLCYSGGECDCTGPVPSSCHGPGLCTCTGAGQQGEWVAGGRIDKTGLS
jgi:hypothetical protein